MPDEKEVKEIVRRIVYRTVGRAPAPGGGGLLTQEAVRAHAPGAELQVPEGTLVTPLARQEALDRKIRLVTGADAGSAEETGGDGETIALGADHGGYELKEALKGHLAELGFGVLDCGTHDRESVDYPDFAFAVARLVAQGRASRGVIVDGAGIGSCMVANKVPGIRAALCYDQATAVNSREHNHANVLTLGAALIGQGLAKQILATWLATPVGGDRHARRVAKIMDVERRFSKEARGSAR